MKMIVNVAMGLGLFGGALFGGLAATGRLNHEGVANLPVLASLFPAPAQPAAGETNDDAEAKSGEHGDQGADAKDAHAETGAGHGTAEASAQGQDPAGDKPLRKGRSLVEPPAAKTADGHGGEKPTADGHGAQEPAGKTPPPNGNQIKKAEPHAAPHAAERDFDAAAAHTQDGYRPGAYFKFDGLPASVTPERLNEAWQRVQAVQKELGQRKDALDLRERDLQALEQDIARRQAELGREHTRIETLQKELDRKVEQFQQQVKLIRVDEVAALKKNAQTLEALEPARVAALWTTQWKTDEGQDEVVKTLELMNKDKANDVLQALPDELMRQLLQKRMLVSREQGAAQK